MADYMCEKGYSCCNFKYYNSEKDFETEAKECEHLVEVATVVHGKWIPDEIMGKGIMSRNYTCSNCGARPYEIDNYCPHCGAKMEK